MTKLLSLGVVLTVVVAISPAPAAAQSREQRQMMATLQMLQEQAQQLAISLATLQQLLDDSIKAVNARIDDANNATRRGFADQKVAIDNIGSDLSKVRERADDTNVRIATLRDELEAVRATVLAFPQQLTLAPVDPASAAAPVTTQPSAPVAPPPAAPSIAGLSPTRMYETARADYFAGQYSVAISGFEQFLKAFPRSELADDAEFNIGEAQFAQNRWAEAITAYNAVVQAYPMSNSVPDALYKRGLAQERLGQVDAARASWEAVVMGYQDSDAGRLAKQNLDRLAARRP
jgi:tol-pal system protein YbgF